MSNIEKPLPSKFLAGKSLLGWLRDWLLKLGSALTVLGLGVFSLFWAYQLQTYLYRLDLTDPANTAYLTNFQPPQHLDQPDFNYRRTGAQSFISLNYPSTPFEVTFRAAALRPDGRPVEMQVSLNGSDVRLFALDNEPREYTLRSRLLTFGPQGLELGFRPLATFADSQGMELGVALDWVEVRQAASRFGPVIPPPFVMGWWLVIAALPLGLARLVGRPFRLGLILSGATFVLLDLLYLLPGPAIIMRLDWAQIGALLVVLQIVTIWGVGFVSRLKWPVGRRGLRLPIWSWLLIGLVLLYLATASGRLTTQPELYNFALSYNLAHWQPDGPIDVLLPDPPPGLINPPHATQGLAHAALAAPFYRLYQRLARGTPYLPDAGVFDSGLLPYLMTWVNLALNIATILTLYWLVRRLGYAARTALLVGALAGLTTTLWPDAHTFATGPLENLAFLAVVSGALFYPERFGRGWAWLSGLGLALLIADSPGNWFLLPALAVYFLIVRRYPRSSPSQVETAVRTETALLAAPPVRSLALVRPKPEPSTFRPGLQLVKRSVVPPAVPSGPVSIPKVRSSDSSWLLALLGPVAVVVILLSWYNLAAFGSLLGGPTVNQFDVPVLDRLYDWLLSPAQGLLWHSPVLLVGLAGGLVWWQTAARPDVKLIVGLSLVYALGRLTWPWSLSPGWQLLEPLVAPLLLLVVPVAQWATTGNYLERWGGRFMLILTGSLGLAAQLGQISSAQPPFAPDFYRTTPLGFFSSAFQTSVGLLLVGWLLLAALSYLRLRPLEEL